MNGPRSRPSQPVKARRFSSHALVRSIIKELTMSQPFSKVSKMSPAVEVARQLRDWIADDVRARNQRGVVNAIYQVSRAYGLTPRRVRAIYHNEVKAPLAWEYLQVQKKRERLAAMHKEANEIREAITKVEGRCSGASGPKRPWF